MAIYLRQICLVADDLEPAVNTISDVFAIPVCHVDPEVGKFGLENSLLAVGTQFLEVVAPVQDNTAADRFLKRRGGAGGYMVICQATRLAEQAELRARAVQQGVRVAYESDRGTWNIMQLHPADMGAAFLEVDWDAEADATGNWQPAGGKAWQGAVSTAVVSEIVAVELQSDDPEALGRHWAAVMGLPLEYRQDTPTISLANADLRFVRARDGRGAGLSALDLRVIDRARLLRQAQRRGVRVSDEHVAICGTRFHLID